MGQNTHCVYFLKWGGGCSKTRSTLDFARSYFCEVTKSLAKVNCRRYAFTLAEVLITITVIGVVAALTIPNLVNNYQNRAWNTASVVFQRKLGEALKVMNSQGTLAGYSSTEDFVNELSKHIKINKICKNDDLTSCFEDTITWSDEERDITKIINAKNFGLEGWNTNTVGVLFGDGVSGIIAYNPECSQDPYRTDVINVSDTGIGTDCLAILYDTSGFKKPNTQSKDLRNLNVASIGGKNCAIQLSDGTCFTSFITNTAVSKTECEQMILDGYPINSGCYYETDYWAGAVKTCHDMGSRLPTQSELTAIANEIYDKPISETGRTNANRDIQKAAQIGMSVSSSGWFYLWSNEDRTNQYSNARYFGTTYTTTHNSYVRDESSSMICLGE